MKATDFIIGQTYESKAAGLLTYKGLDVYFGETTLEFKTPGGKSVYVKTSGPGFDRHFKKVKLADSTVVQFKKLHNDAQIPKRQTEGAAGFDLYSSPDMSAIELKNGETAMIPTGIAVAIPPGYVGLVKPRSGWAVSFGIDTMAGVIDSDYRGQIHVLLTCHNESGGQLILSSERIAQLVVVPVCLDAVEVDELDETERGDNGFGSTGSK